MKSVKILICLLFIIISNAAIQWYANQPQMAGTDLPPGKFKSLSFAPFREGYSPLDKKFPLPEHIDQDLSLLAGKTQNIRTYSILDGMERTPEFAGKHGIDVIQGGWLEGSTKRNKKEIQTLIESVNAHPDVIKRVIVGNEVLLRHDMSVEALIDYIRQVKQAVKQPVSYADVWSIYLKYPQLFNEVDFITIHILPYWEDEPIGIDQATAHVEKIVRLIEAKAHSMGQDKPILIGESGWPSAGRQRGKAIPSVVNETKFIRGLIEVANRHGFDYNIVEAFNQPWKSHNEGVVGANWGLLSADRQPMFPLTGPVIENSHWQWDFGIASGLFLIIAGVYFKKLQTFAVLRLLIFLTLAQLFGTCLVTQADFMWLTSYSFWQRAYTVMMLAANFVLAIGLIQRNYELLAEIPNSIILATRLRIAYQVFALFALYKTISLAFIGRSLSFPIEEFAIPVIGVCGLIACLGLKHQDLDWHSLSFRDLLEGGEIKQKLRDRQIAQYLSLAAVAMLIGETCAFWFGEDFVIAHPDFIASLPLALGYTFTNQQLLIWIACVLILSVPFWGHGGHNDQRLSLS
ncbi:exo-beta-1,3-glucanase [Methylomonas paludis]|uniref:Endo-1,3-beta-glucanase btgC n=1 Tax=Methylomonas paludis TaxID=1173101 RepID=A0A975MPB7_9GAMM|nr:glycosyl hydrolase family 17 protein [Methylomonas paludis]QWF71455.1 exo-beta-1,3-glucanase [Methylomonas paludis]